MHGPLYCGRLTDPTRFGVYLDHRANLLALGLNTTGWGVALTTWYKAVVLHSQLGWNEFNRQCTPACSYGRSLRGQPVLSAVVRIGHATVLARLHPGTAVQAGRPRLRQKL